MSEFKALNSGDPAPAKAKSIWVSCLSNFSVQYNFAVIAICLKMMKEQYPQNDLIKESLKGVVFAGAITGQLVMGYVGDILGRNRALALTIALAGIGALVSAFGSWGDREVVYGVIASARFILGVGVGGVYPLSAAKAAEESESVNIQERNLRVSKAFFWQTPGAMAPYLLAIPVLLLINDHQWQFRFMLAVGSIPTLFIFYATVNAEDSQEFKKDSDISTMALLKDPENWKKLICTGGCWFIYDVVYYGTALFSPTIVANIFGDSKDLVRLAWQNALVQVVGIPSTAFGIWWQQKYGTRNLQILGFFLIAGAFALLAVTYNPLNSTAVFIFFMFLNATLTFGPNISTFILPSEIYEPKVRSTMNGISAALGKMGAICGTYMYEPIYEEHGMPALMWVAGAIAFVGGLLSWYLCPESDENVGYAGVDEDEEAHGRDFDADDDGQY